MLAALQPRCLPFRNQRFPSQLRIRILLLNTVVFVAASRLSAQEESGLCYDSHSNPTNSDGANPPAGLVFSGDTLYETAESGGIAGAGTVSGLSFQSAPQLNILGVTLDISLREPK